MVSGSHGNGMFDFIWNCQTFPELYNFAFPPTMYRSSTCSSFLLPHGIVICVYLTILIGICGTSYLVCISLLNDDAVYLWKCLFTIDMSSLVSVQILWQFLKIVLFIFLFLSYENSLQILNTSHLLPPHFWKRLYRIDITIIF